MPQGDTSPFPGDAARDQQVQKRKSSGPTLPSALADPDEGWSHSADDPLQNSMSPCGRANEGVGGGEGSGGPPRACHHLCSWELGWPRGHHKTQRYLRAIWRLAGSCDLTVTERRRRGAQRTKPRATVHGDRVPDHRGQGSRGQARSSSLLSWRPRAEAADIPEEGSPESPRNRERPQPGPPSQASPVAPTADRPLLRPVRLFTGPQRSRPPGQAHTHPHLLSLAS